MFKWLMVYNMMAPSDGEVEALVSELFSNLDVDNNGTLESSQLLAGARTIPIITSCFSRNFGLMQLPDENGEWHAVESQRTSCTTLECSSLLLRKPPSWVVTSATVVVIAVACAACARWRSQGNTPLEGATRP